MSWNLKIKLVVLLALITILLSSQTYNTNTGRYYNTPINSGATGYSFMGGTAAGPNITTNATKVWAVQLPNGISNVAKFQLDVTTAATGTDTYGMGFYTVGGTRLCNVTDTATNLGITGTGQKVMTFSTTCNMPNGQYYFAITGSIAGTALALGGTATTPTNRCGVAPDTGSATSGGALNTSITVTTFSLTTCTFPQLSISQ